MRSSSKSHVGLPIIFIFIIVNILGALVLASKTTVLKRFTKDDAALITHLVGSNLRDYTGTTVITDGILFESIYYYSRATIRPAPLMRQLYICADKKFGSSARETCLQTKAAIVEARGVESADNLVAILQLPQATMPLALPCLKFSRDSLGYEYFGNYLILEFAPQQRNRWRDLLKIVDCSRGS